MFHRRLALARKPLRFIRPSSDAVLRNAVHRLIALSIYLLLIALLLLVAPAARADAGAHPVDSVNPEAPDVCHLESRAARHGSDSGSLDVSPARPPYLASHVGIDDVVQHVLGEGTGGTNTQAIALFLTMRC